MSIAKEHRRIDVRRKRLTEGIGYTKKDEKLPGGGDESTEGDRNCRNDESDNLESSSPTRITAQELSVGQAEAVHEP